MPSKPATKLYTVYYNDSTYLSYNFTKKDYDHIAEAVMDGRPAVMTTIGLLAVQDIRSVILQKIKADVPQHQGVSPDLPKEAVDWLKAAKLADQLLIESDEEDDEYEGGIIT